MIDSPALTAALQKMVLELEEDLRARVEGDADLRGQWVVEHSRAVQRGRTAAAWVAWRDDRVTQAAVAWVLTSVFVRFCEDNGLVSPVWIAGPEHRRQEALDAQLAFFRAHPLDTDREWLLQAVQHLAGLPATAELVDPHAALHLVSPSGDAVTRLLAFWRQRTEDGRLLYDFTDGSLSTRFLGDLYQDLSAYAKATFALLQTPVFVEEFILDRTLEPALDDRPLEGFRMIDPTCGSGHFLLGAFERLLGRWQKHAPAMEKQALVQQALDAVHGVDLNPFAVAIARFRLTVAALEACEMRSLEQAPAFRFHLAVGDSLLHGPGQQTLAGDADLSGFTYATEDLEVLQTILTGGRYDVVVGNPPYITVKDKVLNQAYRDRYSTCKGKYALSVPFMERFFGLAKRAYGEQPAGWVGQITSNSFMKREFGSKLIEEFLVRMDLRLVADTSGCYIPGHGTPTVVMVGRHQAAIEFSKVRGVLARAGETARDFTVSGGPLWRSLVEHVDELGYEDAWLEVVDFPGEALEKHPWSLGGGGAQELKQTIDTAGTRHVSDLVRRVGFFGITGADEMFLAPPSSWQRLGVQASAERRHVAGEEVRDWRASSAEVVFFPYNKAGAILSVEELSAARYVWPARTLLSARRTFAGITYAEAGRPWWGWHQLPSDEEASSTTLAYANVATHTHFAEADSSYAFNSKAVVMKFERRMTRDVVAGLAALLNSSTALFWLRTVALPKPLSGEEWQRRYEFDATKVGSVPLPATMPDRIGLAVFEAARSMSELTSPMRRGTAPPSEQLLADGRGECEALVGRMIALQEELDWDVYRRYGIIAEDLTYAGEELPTVNFGERAFEIALARSVEAGDEETAWFVRHGATAVTEVPESWPEDYRQLVQRRMKLVAADPAIGLLERPEHKRRWASESWEKRQARALRHWLLARLEEGRFWFDGQGRPSPKSVAQLADEVARDADLVSVLGLWEGKRDVQVSDSLVRLLEPEAVPYLAAYRYRDSGLRTREAWEQTWALQRREDAGEQVGIIPVPPKYAAADFRKPSYWQARGKLDVPKERFILYPDAGRDTDPTPLLGWAGWDHAQQSLALSLIIGARESEGWADERLVPLAAGLAELQPWVEQWHDEVDPIYGVSLAAFTREQLTQRMTQVGRSLDELAAWRPAPATRGRKPRES